MREPIIIEADDGFHFVATRSFAEISLEAIDIENGEYAIYDADGFKLDLSAAPNGGGLISSRQILADCRPELESKLRRFFVSAGIPESEVSQAGFSELVELGVDRFLEHPPKPLNGRLWGAIHGLFKRRNKH